MTLNKEQQKTLDQLIGFEDEPILYIDEIPRPSDPWYEISCGCNIVMMTFLVDLDKKKSLPLRMKISNIG